MKRRQLLTWMGLGALGLSNTALAASTKHSMNLKTSENSNKPVNLFLCGDVMTGRGIDQILPHPSSPEIHEDYITNALGYVKIAERANGPIPAPVSFDYIWGDALQELHRMSPDLRLINLETAVTRSDRFWPGKGINYRMHPDNIPCLQAAAIDGCILANNHVLDWGYEGLAETLDTIEKAGMQSIGAGRSAEHAEAPAVFNLSYGRRVLVVSLAHPSSGTPLAWSAGKQQAGIYLIEDLSDDVVQAIARKTSAHKQPGDLLIVSIHWGGNWGYQVAREQRDFAYKLIDEAGVDVVHGHSSHHPKAIEIYHDRPIFYGCGDLLNDYEGIATHGQYRDDLTLMYFPILDPSTGRLLKLVMIPMQIRKFRLQHPSRRDQQWLLQTMNRECNRFGGRVLANNNGHFELHWS